VRYDKKNVNRSTYEVPVIIVRK